MNKNRVKNIIAVAIATVVVAGLSIGVTYALLNKTTNTVTNIFTPTKEINAILDEPKWTPGTQLVDEKGKLIDENGVATTTPVVSKWKDPVDGTIRNAGDIESKGYGPKSVIGKDPRIQNTSDGTHTDEYVAIKLAYIIKGNDNKDHEVSYAEFTSKVASINWDKTSNGSTAVVNGFNDAWKNVDGKNQIFYYVGTNQAAFEVVKKDEYTKTIFDRVIINDLVSIDTDISYTDINGTIFTAKKAPSFDIKATGFAIQSDNVSNEINGEAKAALDSLIAGTYSN